MGPWTPQPEAARAAGTGPKVKPNPSFHSTVVTASKQSCLIPRVLSSAAVTWWTLRPGDGGGGHRGGKRGLSENLTRGAVPHTGRAHGAEASKPACRPGIGLGCSVSPSLSAFVCSRFLEEGPLRVVVNYVEFAIIRRLHRSL